MTASVRWRSNDNLIDLPPPLAFHLKHRDPRLLDKLMKRGKYSHGTFDRISK